MTDLKHKIISELKSIKSWSNGVKEELLARADRPELSLTSLPDFNHKLWGLKKGLTVLASRTSQGKSSLMLQWCYDLAMQGIPTCLFSLEDDVPTIIEKLFCQQRKIDNYSLMKGDFALSKGLQDEWDRFVETIPKTLLISCGIGSTFDEINYMVESLTPKPKCIVVDYIQAIKMGSKNERENLNEYIRQFRAVCIKNGIAGILVSQMNRMAAGEEGRLSLENLKSTGVLEEHAELVILLQWNYFYDRKEATKNEYTILIAKNKRGRTGKHIINFFPEYYRFEEVNEISDSYYEPEGK